MDILAGLSTLGMVIYPKKEELDTTLRTQKGRLNNFSAVRSFPRQGVLLEGVVREQQNQLYWQHFLLHFWPCLSHRQWWLLGRNYTPPSSLLWKELSRRARSMACFIGKI
jgi:hypothetical protein